MPLQSSGAISLLNIQGEFGGSSNNIAISNYYRGGSNVPNTTVNNSIPTSGQIQFDDFYGGTALSADNQIAFSVQQYSVGSGKNVFTVRGANSSLSDGSLTTNNLNSYTVIEANKIYPDSGNVFGFSITFSGTGNGYNAYTTGLVRGLSWTGNGTGSASFFAPSSSSVNSLMIPASNAIEQALSTLNTTITFTFTY